MNVIEAIRQSPTPDAVYFLLTAYLETLGEENGYGVAAAKRRPISSSREIGERLRLLTAALRTRADVQPVFAEAIHVFRAAERQLTSLSQDTTCNQRVLSL